MYSPFFFNSAVSGRKVTVAAGTAILLAASSTPCLFVLVSPLATNTNTVAVGDSAVLMTAGSEKGVQLQKTSHAIGLWITNLNLLYVDSVVSGEGVAFTYFS